MPAQPATRPYRHELLHHLVASVAIILIILATHFGYHAFDPKSEESPTKYQNTQRENTPANSAGNSPELRNPSILISRTSMIRR